MSLPVEEHIKDSKWQQVSRDTLHLRGERSCNRNFTQRARLSTMKSLFLRLSALYLLALISAQAPPHYQRFTAGVTEGQQSNLQAWLSELVSQQRLDLLLGQLNGEHLESQRHLKKWILDSQEQGAKCVTVPLTDRGFEREYGATCSNTLDPRGLESESQESQSLTSMAGRLQSFTRNKGGIGFRFGK
ncbi:hypothetical protein chiPu_0021800 [Chiloscyllium punctatum]|uniref:Uncharacterized protein n=1 Tax=Chiloscyllium punctatum TaxID=137246 RepID=A0A401RM96_CHIPU|nr:hypothetical protein [Chiloscyllium punctatum]